MEVLRQESRSREHSDFDGSRLPATSEIWPHHPRLPPPSAVDFGDGPRTLRVPCVADVEASDLEGRDPLASLRPAGLEALAPHLQQIGAAVPVEAVDVGAVLPEGEAALAPLAQYRQPPAVADAFQGRAAKLAPRGGAHLDFGGCGTHSPAHSDQVRHRPLSAPSGAREALSDPCGKVKQKSAFDIIFDSDVHRR